MTIQLTQSQQAILNHAHEHTDGKIIWFPDNIKGGARKKVLDGLFNRALITAHADVWFIAAKGYDAIGVERRVPIISLTDIDKINADAKLQQPTSPRKTRDNSKQAQVIAMLRRPEGTTIAQIMEATGWQAHTVRGTFAGAFKKKLGLEIMSDKNKGSDRIYRISQHA